MSFETKKFNKIEVNTFYLGNIPQKRIQIHWRKSTVFKNHRKSLIQHCERSELGLHFEWTKVHQKCSILASFLETYGQTVLPDKSLFKGQKLVENGQFLKNLWSNSVIRSLLIGQKLTENTKIKKFKCDILSDFQTLCKPFKRNPSFAFLCKDKQFFFLKKR